MKFTKLDKIIEVNNFKFDGKRLSAIYSFENQQGTCHLEFLYSKGTHKKVLTISKGSSLILDDRVINGLIIPKDKLEELREVKEEAIELYQTEVSKMDKIEDDEIEFRNEEEAKKRREVKALVEATGEAQILKRYSTECDDPDEECNLDYVTIWLLPNGRTIEKRQHTW